MLDIALSILGFIKMSFQALHIVWKYLIIFSVSLTLKETRSQLFCSPFFRPHAGGHCMDAAKTDKPPHQVRTMQAVVNIVLTAITLIMDAAQMAWMQPKDQIMQDVLYCAQKKYPRRNQLWPQLPQTEVGFELIFFKLIFVVLLHSTLDHPPPIFSGNLLSRDLLLSFPPPSHCIVFFHSWDIFL